MFARLRVLWHRFTHGVDIADDVPGFDHHGNAIVDVPVTKQRIRAHSRH